MTLPSARPVSGGWHHRFAVLVASATFLLIIAGGLVTSTGSGLAVPDWPLSFGQVFPRMEGGVLFEHGHRLIASFVGLLTAILAVWTWRTEPRRGVRILGWTMLGVVILQGVLGGITVLMRLPDAVSVAHAGMAQVFFALTVVMADVSGTTDRRTDGPTDRRTDGPTDRSAAAGDASWLGPSVRRSVGPSVVLLVVAVYLQIILGAIVRHIGAGLAIPDFPLSNGRLIPDLSTSLVAWAFAHRAGALVVTLLVFVTAIQVLRRHTGRPRLTRPAVLLVLLVCGQVLLGALTIWKGRAVTPTTAHVAGGALVFAFAVLLAVRSYAQDAQDTQETDGPSLSVSRP